MAKGANLGRERGRAKGKGNAGSTRAAGVKRSAAIASTTKNREIFECYEARAASAIVNRNKRRRAGSDDSDDAAADDVERVATREASRMSAENAARGGGGSGVHDARFDSESSDGGGGGHGDEDIRSEPDSADGFYTTDSSSGSECSGETSEDEGATGRAAATRRSGVGKGAVSCERYLDNVAAPGPSPGAGDDSSQDSDEVIRGRYLELKRADMFVVAASGVDNSDLTMSERADREAFAEKNAARKRRSAHSQGAANSNVALFCAWMDTRRDLREDMDLSAASLYYPSPAKLIAFIRWQESRGDLRGDRERERRRSVHAGSIQTSIANLSAWADHLRHINPRQFSAGVAKPCTNDSVVLVMRSVHEKHAGALTQSRGEYLDGVAAIATYGKTRHRSMAGTLFPRQNPRDSLRLLADTNLRHALICRGELTRGLTFNNLALLPEDLTPQVGRAPTRAMLVTVRKGKTIKYGRARSIMCLEALDVTLCPIFSLALYLFWRFDVDKDDLPNFEDRAKWYTARVFTGQRHGTPYTESAQYSSVRSLHRGAGVWGKVVHGARVSASQEDARNRVPPLETQCVTHAKDSRGGSIGTSTLVYRPLSTMSAISQSGAVGRGQTAATATYFCARQEVEVPPALCREVFKGFTAALDKLEAGGEWGGCTATTNTERATLELMCHLRLVLCRGAVELRPRFPDFALYKKYPFNSRLFLDWAEPALAEIGKLKGEEAAARLKSGVSPAVADELNLMSSRQEAITARLDSLQELVERSEKTARKLMEVAVQLASETGEGADRLRRLLDKKPEPEEAQPHREGWFTGKLPGLGQCGTPGRELSSLWECWAGRGPAFVQGTGEGLNLRSHGRVTLRQANAWASSSTYNRYRQAGKYMESLLLLVQANKPCDTYESQVEKMLDAAEKQKGNDSVTQWYNRCVMRHNRDEASAGEKDSS